MLARPAFCAWHRQNFDARAFTRALGAVGSKYRRTRESALVRQPHSAPELPLELNQAAAMLLTPFIVMNFTIIFISFLFLSGRVTRPA